MSAQGEPLSWRRTLKEQLLDVFDRHGAEVTVALTTTGVQIRSLDSRVDASYGLSKAAAPVEEGTEDTSEQGYGLVLIARHSVNLKSLPMSRRGEADLILGKNNVVLKDRYGTTGINLPERTVARILANATDVVQV